ncbi:hypothetical protein G6F16_007501 [Rhizopus arrhizus]|nr:hypothetical protein G6F23_008967 [Rhizopus arrhizus]KAG0763492.1 hypothetical protein G6F24_005971 [Rhizopus arrhizus]KAG0790333.1 hypothetical protein G6F21_005881 [Rhizopus arrhizus]KAG0815402.1 hypothetical protein G6F20_004011 [Rhizopus arrhizus]KAG0831705.1 hypothetical protein G6F19_006596 [Rhizopus arrhizus]
MGITGLLPLLAPITKPIHIQEYAGKIVAIDGHCWLHKGSFSCALELALNQPTTKYVSYFMNLINMLRFYKVIPLVVFDGQSLPMKQETNSKRAQKRKESFNIGFKLVKDNKIKEALPYLQQSISITQDMIQQVVKKLDEIGVQHVIAPYEADAQLAYLLKNNYAQAAVTEDSDLLAFGCSTVIFKLNRYGDCMRIHFEDISKVIDIKPFSVTTLRHICMLSGCDYLPSLKGIGLKTAETLIKKHLTIEKVMKALRFRQNIARYQQDFERAETAFLHQFVYDVKTRQFVRLNELPKGFKQEYLPSLGCDPKESTGTKDTYIAKSINLLNRYCNKELNKENIPPWFNLYENSASCKDSSNNASGSSPAVSSGDDGAAAAIVATKTSVTTQTVSANKTSLKNKFKALVKNKAVKNEVILRKENIPADNSTKQISVSDNASTIKRKYSFSSSQEDDYPSSLPSLASSISTDSSQDENVKPVPVTLGKRKDIDNTSNQHVSKKRVLGTSTNIRFIF